MPRIFRVQFSASLSHKTFKFRRAQCSLGPEKLKRAKSGTRAGVGGKALLMNELFSTPDSLVVLRHWFGINILELVPGSQAPDSLQTAFHIKSDTQMRARRGMIIFCLSNMTCADFQDLARKKIKIFSCIFRPDRWTRWGGSKGKGNLSWSRYNLLVVNG